MTAVRYPRALAAAVATFATTLGAACAGEAESAASAAVVRDSAGVTIVESTGPTWPAGGGLALDPEPLVAIGEEGGPPESQLYQVRAGFRMADGRIAVFDGGSNELRFFDGDGAFLSKVGGKGGAPGEYQFVSQVSRLPGDSLLVDDVMGQRLTVLAPDGSVARTINMAAAAPPTPPGGGTERVSFVGMSRYDVVGPFADGTLLARGSSFGGMNRQDGTVTRDSVTYVRLAADGTLLDTLGRFAGDERQAASSGSGDRQFVMYGPAPFGRTAQAEVDGDGFWFGSTDRYVLGRYDQTGRLTRLVRRPVEPLPVRPEDAEALKARELSADRPNSNPEMAANLKRAVESKWENAVLPERMPAHGPLVVDRGGRLWVRQTRPPADSTPRYDVFDREGRLLGEVTLPVGFRVLDIGEDYVLGVGRDENDVEQVRLHALRAAPTAG